MYFHAPLPVSIFCLCVCVCGVGLGWVRCGVVVRGLCEGALGCQAGGLWDETKRVVSIIVWETAGSVVS